MTWHKYPIFYGNLMNIDNIIICNLVDGLSEEQLGILPTEQTIRFSFDQMKIV